MPACGAGKYLYGSICTILSREGCSPHMILSLWKLNPVMQDNRIDIDDSDKALSRPKVNHHALIPAVI
ncbi:hypothetical protein CKAN_01854100 [Cinnamomum micranthum f. kanehirae]|uniref:Uncharacterized protein n=1 Tax=Cinnamomum micranthum f. kanehirae TaxID=337451 RepID=A0A443PFH1_9MAGN|nr:hypothetical protein CKAN_01854100 [Cinnamomum micranthum f. kanehirae]